MKSSYKSLWYHIKFDGDLLLCKPRKWVPGSTGLEIPINIVLDYQYKSFARVKRLTLHINKYFHGQKQPEIRVLKPIYLINPSQKGELMLLNMLDKVILENLSGTNVGLYHIPAETLQQFYQLYTKRNGALKLASMRIVYSASDTTKGKGMIVPLPEWHSMAS